MICKNCRHEVEETQTICGYCGAILKKSKADKAPWICALYAPLSILIIMGIDVLTGLIPIAWPYSYLIRVVVDVLAIIISFTLYFLFTMKQRANLSIWLFLLAPGSIMLVDPLRDFLYFIFYLLRDEFGLYMGGVLGSLIADIPFVVAAFLQAIISYIVVGLIFKKMLKSRVDI